MRKRERRMENYGIENADDAWEDFLEDDGEEDAVVLNNKVFDKSQIPTCSPIYVSTKTKIAYLNQEIPLEEMFWKINILQSYALPKEGVVKKEMKFKTYERKELENILDNIPKNAYVEQHIKTHIDKEEGSIKFRDIRKISIGLCKKKLISFRSKAKGAFFNCFALILRIRWQDGFREIHVKVFNTGKLEIPGIPGDKSDEFLNYILVSLVNILQPIADEIGMKEPLHYKPNSNETVLINSNFSANYYIDREKLKDILKTKYRIMCNLDPCSYPGIQCEFHYLPSRTIQDGKPPSENEKELPSNIISFMIFRTGSVLIVGKFEEEILEIVYDFIKQILYDEFENINNGILNKVVQEKQNMRKTKKRFIYIETVA